MASIIRVKRSTGTVPPASLNFGELGLTVGVGTHGNFGGRLFAGDNSSNTQLVGGRYYTDLLSIAPGLVAGQSNPTTPSNGFVAILNSSRKVDEWNVDNITIDGNTVSSTNTDGDINLDPNGTGEIVIPDDTYLTFGTSKDTKIKYDEATDDRLEVTGADWNFANGVAVSLSDTTASSSTSTGALVVTGGVGIGASLNVAGNVDFDSDLNIDGGDVTSNTASLNLFNSNVITANILGAATALNIGATSGIATINNPTVVGTQATQNLYNTVATSVNAFGAATGLNIGATTGIATINNPTVVGTQATQNLYNTVATSVNAFGAATNIIIGATSGIATIRNSTVSFNNSANTSFVSIAATTNASSTTTGALRVAGGVGIVSDVYIGGNLNVTGTQTFTGNTTFTNNITVQGNTTLGNSGTDILTVTGISTFIGSINHTGVFSNTGGVLIDNIGISSNVISTKSGGGNTLYIDPYPDGLSNEGVVVIKGDLQIDGTTTTVNSSTVSANEVIFNLGDITSVRTIVSPVLSGVSTITLDSVVGINTGDIISGPNGLPVTSANRTVTSYNGTSKVITIAGTTTSGISTTTQLTVSHYYDTNTDRGISFEYNTSSGVANSKKGFFGFKDNTGYFTFIPDATFTNSVVTGTKGTLDIGALYLNFVSSGISTRGSAYFDSNGKLISTSSPEVGYASTSNYVLTTNASNVPVWTDTLDGGTF